MQLSEIEQYFEAVEISIKRESDVYTFIEYQLLAGYWLKIGDGFYNRYEYIDDGSDCTAIDIFPEDECDGVITLRGIDSELPEWSVLSKVETTVVLEG